jgi:hypothetical protein
MDYDYGVLGGGLLRASLTQRIMEGLVVEGHADERDAEHRLRQPQRKPTGGMD